MYSARGAPVNKVIRAPLLPGKAINVIDSEEENITKSPNKVTKNLLRKS